MNFKIKMKNNISLPFLYIFLHLAAITAFGISVAKGRFSITSDLFSMIPETSESRALQLADKRLTGSSGKSVFILSRAGDFARARENAGRAYQALKAAPEFSDYFESLTLYSDGAAYTEIFDFIRRYRANLLDEKTVIQLEDKEGIRDFAKASLAGIYSGFSLAPLDDLENDPYFLDQVHLRRLMQILSDSGTNMSLKDGVLAAEFEGDWFVMIQGTLTDKGAALAQKKNGLQLIYDICLPMEGNSSGGSYTGEGEFSAPASFVFSGTPFHSHKSSTKASFEISLISTLSLLAVLAMLIFVFRTPLPIFAAFSSILLAVSFAFSMTAAIFGQVHALTLVFGTSLIGSCIDYSLHFFVNWKANPALTSGSQIRSFLKKGLILSLVSTEICYFLLIFAPFPLLKQMAVFSLSGILSSFLTVMMIYPLFGLQSHEKRIFKLILKSPLPAIKPLHRSIFLLAMTLIPLITLIVNHSKVQIKNNLSALYKMEGRLKNDTILASRVLNYTPSSWFVLRADSEEELLRLEEKFTKTFQTQTGKDGKENHKFLCTSLFVPSAQNQKASINAVKNLAASREITEELYEYLDFENPDQLALKYEKNTCREAEILRPESPLPSQLKKIIDLLWLGQIDGKFYSVFMPTSNLPESIMESLAEPEKGIFYQNKVRQIGQGLDRLSKMILLMLGIASLVILLVLRLFFSLKETLKIAAVPLLSLLWILTVFVISGSPIDFFCITGIILVFGLGIDYIIYMTGHEGGRLETAAIILSFLTTAISFGALALSSFVPVHATGLSIFTGLTAAFLATMALAKPPADKC